VTVRRGDQYTSRAIRGVQFLKYVSLFENGGTLSAPTQGDAQDLSDWQTLLVAARGEGLEGVEYAMRGLATYEFTSPARIALSIAPSELEKAVVETSSGVELRPIRITVRATNSGGGQRTLLNGVIHLLPGGYTE
jgi:hypothetical protein